MILTDCADMPVTAGLGLLGCSIGTAGAEGGSLNHLIGELQALSLCRNPAHIRATT